MTRGDYELIAGTLRTAFDRAEGEGRAEPSVRREVAGRLARRLEARSDRFDAQRFVDACGVPRG